MKSSNSQKTINLMFYIIVFFGFFVFLQNNQTDLSFKVVTNEYILFVILLKFLNFFIFNQLHMEIFKIYQLKISSTENFELTYKGYIGNFFGFGKSGTGYKAIFLKNKYNFSYLKFISFYVFLQTLTLFGTSIVCLFVLTIFETNLLVNKSSLTFLLIFIMLSCIFVNLIFKFISRLKILRKIPYLDKFISNLDEIRLVISKNYFLIKKTYTILLLQFILQFNLFFQIFFQGKALSIDISLLSNFVYNLISQISIFLSITPNSIGIKEFFLVISNQFIGLTPTQVFDLAIVDRITDFLSLILFTILFNSIKKLFKNS